MITAVAWEGHRTVNRERLLLTAIVPRLTMEFLKVGREFTFKMLAHRYISLVMTALVLACPFQCGDGCGVSRTHSCVDSDGCNLGDDAPCCCHCGHGGRVPRDDDSQDGSKKLDCFCNGAVLSDGTKCPDHDVAHGFFAVVVPHSSTTRQYTGTSSRDSALLRASHFPPLVSGRDIRALVDSYLL